MKLAQEHFPQMSAHVEGARNLRFAQFFGFQPVRKVEIEGKMLVRMEWQPDSQ